MAYPTSIDNVPDLQDGVDYIEADDVNVVKDEAESAQTFVGASGAAQSHNTDILTQLIQELPTIKISYKDAATVTASAGVCKPCNAALTIRKLRQNTSTTDITGADLDSGGPALAASTTYYVYADGSASGTTVAFSVSTDAATPGDTTVFKLVGGFATDGSGNVIESTVWSIAGSRCVNIKTATIGDLISINTQIPADNTKPQKTEGTEVKTLTYCPQKVGNLLEIECIAFVGGASTTVQPAGALFVDDDADAVAAALGGGQVGSSAAGDIVYLKYIIAVVALGQRTYKFRVGPTSAATMYVNGDLNGTQLFSALSISSITVKEWEVA